MVLGQALRLSHTVFAGIVRFRLAISDNSPERVPVGAGSSAQAAISNKTPASYSDRSGKIKYMVSRLRFFNVWRLLQGTAIFKIKTRKDTGNQSVASP